MQFLGIAGCPRTAAINPIQMSSLEHEIWLIEKIKQKSIEAFVSIYQEYSPDLLILAYSELLDPDKAILAVDRLFEELWELNMAIELKPPLHQFLAARLHAICGEYPLE
jgi:hypothetical protein